MTDTKPTNWQPNANQSRAMAEELVKQGLGIEEANKLLLGTGAQPIGAPGSRDAALLQRDRLKGDTDWVKRFLAGDTQAVSEMAQLNAQIVTGESKEG